MGLGGRPSCDWKRDQTSKRDGMFRRAGDVGEVWQLSQPQSPYVALQGVLVGVVSRWSEEGTRLAPER